MGCHISRIEWDVSFLRASSESSGQALSHDTFKKLTSHVVREIGEGEDGRDEFTYEYMHIGGFHISRTNWDVSFLRTSA